VTCPTHARADAAAPPLIGVRPRVRVVVVLAGSVGGRDNSPANGRGVLALPLDGERDVLDEWLARLAEFARDTDASDLDVRIATGRQTAFQDLGSRAKLDRLRVSIVPDRAEFRGTAGTLRDVTADLDPADGVLVAVASHVPQVALSHAIDALQGADEGVCIAQSRRSDVAGLFLLRRERLLSVPEVGFFDLKEQLRLAGQHTGALHAARLPAGSFVPVRTRDEYLSAVRMVAKSARDSDSPVHRRDAFAERWQTSFAIVERGARVAPTAVLQDCVVLEGAVIEAGATVVHSVVCKGGFVERGRVVVDSIITERGERVG